MVCKISSATKVFPYEDSPTFLGMTSDIPEVLPRSLDPSLRDTSQTNYNKSTVIFYFLERRY
jgi:hypothetical protein